LCPHSLYGGAVTATFGLAGLRGGSSNRYRVITRKLELTDDVRNDGDALVYTSGRIGAIVRISTGSPDQHTPKDMEHLLELLRDEIGLMEDQAQSAQERINFMTVLARDTQHKKAVRHAVKNFLDS